MTEQRRSVPRRQIVQPPGVVGISSSFRPPSLATANYGDRERGKYLLDISSLWECLQRRKFSRI
jgi:hypothetical protein